jgi:hypothetical protein
MKFTTFIGMTAVANAHYIFETVEALNEQCCVACPTNTVKYYSIDKTFGHCGESCLNPKDYAAYKLFEPGLTLADKDNCNSLGYTVYWETETHGIPHILSTTVDFYNKPSKATTEVVIGEKAAFSKDQVLKFVSGLILGSLKENHLTEVLQCFNDIQYVSEEMTVAVQDFAAKDLPSIMDAIQHIGNIFVKLPQDFVDCTSMTNNMARIEAWAAPFKNPKEELPKIWTNLLANYVAMVHDLNLMNGKFAKSDIEGAGELAAEILELGLGPVKMAQTPDDIAVSQW